MWQSQILCSHENPSHIATSPPPPFRSVGDVDFCCCCLFVCLFGGFTPYQRFFNHLTATVHKFMFPGLFFFKPVLNQSIILTLADQS